MPVLGAVLVLPLAQAVVVSLSLVGRQLEAVVVISAVAVNYQRLLLPLSLSLSYECLSCALADYLQR